MLYPTYLSSYRNLLKKDISPFSLMKVLVGDKPRSWIPKKPAVSPPEEAKPAEKPASQKITATTRRTAAKPITISDAHSRAVLRGTGGASAPDEGHCEGDDGSSGRESDHRRLRSVSVHALHGARTPSDALPDGGCVVGL